MNQNSGGNNMIFNHAFDNNKEIGPEEELRIFVETLHSGDSGFVVPLKKAPGENMLPFLPSPIHNIQDLMQKIDKECNSYITVNDVDGTSAKSKKGWCYGSRKKDNITHLNALFIDVDIKSCHTKNSSMNADECDRHIQDFENTLAKKIENMEFPDNVITMIVHTGRGVQLYLCYDKRVCCAKSLLGDYKTIQKCHEAAGAHLIKKMSSWFDSDVFQFDAVNNVDRVCRLPGTLNNSAGRFCHIAYLDADAKNSQESLFDLIGFEKETYTGEPLKKEKGKDKKEKSSKKTTQKVLPISKEKTKPKKNIPPQLLLAPDELPRCNAKYRNNALSEIKAIERIAASRIMTKGSKRNMFCFIYYNLQRIFHYEDETLKLTQELNASFEQPLSEEGFQRTITGINLHAQLGSFFTLSKGIYVFRRETIAKLLEFSEEEIQMTNYFGNRDMLLQREENKKTKAAKKAAAIELRKQHYSKKHIAQAVGLSEKTLQNLFRTEGLGGCLAKKGGKNGNNTKNKEKKNKKKEGEERGFSDLEHSQEEISFLQESLRSGKNVQLLGGAGTGKTYQIRQYIDYVGIDKVLILAPTSLAASNFDTGKTIHKGLNIQVGPLYPGASIWNEESYVDELYNKDVIVIDEIGAVRFDLFAFIIAKLKYFEKEYKKKFQLIVMGDFKQLRPVIKEEERALLKEKWGQEWFGTTGFANETNAWNDCNFVEHELTYIYRQEDREFCKAINFARNEQIPECIDYFAKFRNDSEYYNNDGIHLCATNREKNDINTRIVNNFISNNPNKVHSFYAEYDLDKGIDFCYERFPVNQELIVYPGMYVSTVVSTKDYSKDTIGIVGKINKKSLWIKPLNKEESVKIKYENIYSVHGKSIKQLPIVPSYAITVHKSQGQSFNGKVYIHVENFFEKYQLYVALSRVTKSENLTIIGELTKKCFG